MSEYATYPHRSDSQQYPLTPDMAYSTHIPPSAPSSGSSPSSPDESHSPHQTTPKGDQGQPQPAPPPKSEGKQQATFLTKLYALLERPENHHMIRWDPAGEHIIVEKPEQLAIHVLPSVYRQSRFASFSRQLNIYGFMRKVNLRNVDPAIDDPDASTWSHPTLNRHSPPDVVANFKRRVPPRIPKSKKREQEVQPSLAPRSAVGLAPMPPALGGMSSAMTSAPFVRGRARAFTTPGSFTPLSQGGAVGWGTSYPRSQLPPLTVPNDGHGVYGHSHYNHSSHAMSAEEGPGSFNSMPYSSSQREMMIPSSQYSYHDNQTWGFSGGNPPHGGGGSLSSLLNPSSGNGYSSRPSVNTYPAPFSQHGNPSPASVSPDSRPNTGYTDSRPNTGYSVSSMSSMQYDEKPGSQFSHDYQRPGSGPHRPLSPGGSRPGSSHQSYPQPSLSVRRARRHSQAMSPYPSPYGHGDDGRPSTSPHPNDGAEHPGRGPRDGYGFNPAQADFAYSAAPMNGSVDSLNGPGGWDSTRSVRPSTSASSLSGASHTSSSAARTPPGDNYAGETDINRLSPDFGGYVPMNEHVPQYTKAAAEL